MGPCDSFPNDDVAGGSTASLPGMAFFLIFFLFFFKFFKLIYFWLCWVFVSVRGLSLVAASRGHSSSRCADRSLSRPLIAEHRLQTRRLSSCGSQAQLLRGMWDLPRPGLEPASPALVGRLSTTAPPGKPLEWLLPSATYQILSTCSSDVISSLAITDCFSTLLTSILRLHIRCSDNMDEDTRWVVSVMKESDDFCRVTFGLRWHGTRKATSGSEKSKGWTS